MNDPKLAKSMHRKRQIKGVIEAYFVSADYINRELECIERKLSSERMCDGYYYSTTDFTISVLDTISAYLYG